MKTIDARAAAIKLRDGDVLVAELDHVLALICDARNDTGMQLMRTLKNRTFDKGFTILMDSDARINRYVKEVPALAWDIFDTSADAPIIVILPEGTNLSKHALAADGSIAVRRVSNMEEQKLVQMANAPLACTALLRADGSPACSISEVNPQLLTSLEYMLSLPSPKLQADMKKIPVIKLGINGDIKILRE